MSNLLFLSHVNSDTHIDGALDVEKVYYLQQMGINIWQMRDIKPKRRILILIANSYNQQSVSKSAQNLLENMLASTKIDRADFELMFIDSMTDLDKIGFKIYTKVIIMGEDVLVNTQLMQQIHASKIPLITVSHPSYLLINPQAKRKAYLSLCKLDGGYVE